MADEKHVFNLPIVGVGPGSIGFLAVASCQRSSKGSGLAAGGEQLEAIWLRPRFHTESSAHSS